MDLFGDGSAIIDGDTPAWMSAYGGSGKGKSIDTSKDYTVSSMAGARGYAQTAFTLNDVSSDTFYYYIGARGSSSSHAGVGGASTIVSSAELSGDTVLTNSNAILVAGGGGGAGVEGWLFESNKNGGGSGGAGAIVIASVGKATSVSGEDGYSLDGYGDYVGKGGNSDGNGTGGLAAHSNVAGQGEDGWGGDGSILLDRIDDSYVQCEGSERPGWINATPAMATSTSGQGGAGLMGDDYTDDETCSGLVLYEFMGATQGGGGGGGMAAAVVAVILPLKRPHIVVTIMGLAAAGAAAMLKRPR